MAAYAADLLDYRKRTKWILSPWVLTFMRPMFGKEGYAPSPDANRGLARPEPGKLPQIRVIRQADPADPIIASESLGLGSCMVGLPGWGMKYDRRLREKYGVPKGCQPGIVVIFGYPDVKYRRAVRLRFASVRES